MFDALTCMKNEFIPKPGAKKVHFEDQAVPKNPIFKTTIVRNTLEHVIEKKKQFNLENEVEKKLASYNKVENLTRS